MKRDPNYTSRLRAKAWLKFSRRCSFSMQAAALTAEAKDAVLLCLIAPLIAAKHATFLPQELSPTDAELMGAFEVACLRISRKLKMCIDDGHVPVRHLHGLDYASDETDIRSWCATADLDRPFDQDQPPIPFVITKEDLEPFFTLLGITPPRELMTAAAVRNREAVEHEFRQSMTDAVIRRLEDLRREETPDQEPEHRVYWLQVFHAHYARICAKHDGTPKVVDVIRYLKRLGDPRIPNEGPADKLIWITQDGDKTPVQKKTISNHLSQIRGSKHKSE